MYPEFNSIAEAHTVFKRKRKIAYFILTDKGVEKDKPICPHCNKPVDDYGDTPQGFRSNRGIYSPKHKQSKILHYVCSWNSLLDHLFAKAP